jgi:HAD superfamily hydrolase (TIGR01549 family)
MIKVVFFDIGNTLINMFPLDKKHLFKYFCLKSFDGKFPDLNFKLATDCSEIFYQKNCRGSSYNTREFWLEYYKSGFEGAGIDESESIKLSNKVCDDFLKAQPTLTLADETIELLESIKEQKVKIGALSNWSRQIRDVLINFKIEKYFDVIVNSEDAGYEKPDHRIFENAIRDYDPGETMMVGDLYYFDIAPALYLGMNTILYDNVGCLENVFNCKKIKKLMELPSILRTMQERYRKLDG